MQNCFTISGSMRKFTFTYTFTITYTFAFTYTLLALRPYIFVISPHHL